MDIKTLNSMDAPIVSTAESLTSIVLSPVPSNGSNSDILSTTSSAKLEDEVPIRRTSSSLSFLMNAASDDIVVPDKVRAQSQPPTIAVQPEKIESEHILSAPRLPSISSLFKPQSVFAAPPMPKQMRQQQRQMQQLHSNPQYRPSSAQWRGSHTMPAYNRRMYNSSPYHPTAPTSSMKNSIFNPQQPQYRTSQMMITPQTPSPQLFRDNAMRQQQAQQQLIEPAQKPMIVAGIDLRTLSNMPTPKIRENLPKSTTSAMMQWLLENADNPYPSETQKQEMSDKYKLTLTQVNNWFINSRRRVLKRIIKNSRDEAANASSSDAGSPRTPLADAFR